MASLVVCAGPGATCLCWDHSLNVLGAKSHPVHLLYSEKGKAPTWPGHQMGIDVLGTDPRALGTAPNTPLCRALGAQTSWRGPRPCPSRETSVPKGLLCSRSRVHV